MAQKLWKINEITEIKFRPQLTQEIERKSKRIRKKTVLKTKKGQKEVSFGKNIKKKAQEAEKTKKEKIITKIKK